MTALFPSGLTPVNYRVSSTYSTIIIHTNPSSFSSGQGTKKKKKKIPLSITVVIQWGVSYSNKVLLCFLVVKLVVEIMRATASYQTLSCLYCSNTVKQGKGCFQLVKQPQVKTRTTLMICEINLITFFFFCIMTNEQNEIIPPSIHPASISKPSMHCWRFQLTFFRWDVWLASH